jgi:hypothetical protein
LTTTAKAVSNDWKTAAANSGLSASDIQTLENNHLLISNESYKQVFSAYIGQVENPVFITSDSLLNGFHVLFEETIFLLENSNASQLETFLKKMITNLDSDKLNFKGDEKVLNVARSRVKLTLGIAVRLLDPTFRLGQEDLDSVIKLEVKRIEAAEEIISPPPNWLGPPSDDFMGIDYNRYKPRGFYTHSEKLSCYFRALAWLHSIPFRINIDVELLGMILLREGNERSYDEDSVGLPNLYWLFGPPDNPDYFTGAVPSASYINYENDGLKQERSYALERNDWGQINDSQPSFRIISASRTPGSLLFQRTMEITASDRDLPTGLEVAAALGSEKADVLLNGLGHKGLLPTIHEMSSLFPQGYYFELSNGPKMKIKLPGLYYRALYLLLDAPPPDAPDFMSTPSWQLKSINTVLGSWAQMRHTMALQAKESVCWVCDVELPPGFTEPDPEFFEQMASLALAVRSGLNNQSLITDYGQHIEDLHLFADFAKSFKTDDEMDDAFHALPAEKQTALRFGYNLSYYSHCDEFPQVVTWLNKLANDIKEGKIAAYPDIKEMLDYPIAALHERWEQLEQISQKLESIAHKQLRTLPLSVFDEIFIKSYGTELAGLMLYDGNSYLHPRDDAPRVANVSSNIDQGKHLQVGIARARKMYVLYPWQGETILCEGAVLPYYEFAHPTRLNDAEWKTMLGSQKVELKKSALEKIKDVFKPKEPMPTNHRPPIPEWFAPIVEGGSLSVPELDR